MLPRRFWTAVVIGGLLSACSGQVTPPSATPVLNGATTLPNIVTAAPPARSGGNVRPEIVAGPTPIPPCNDGPDVCSNADGGGGGTGVVMEPGQNGNVETCVSATTVCGQPCYT